MKAEGIPPDSPGQTTLWLLQGCVQRAGVAPSSNGGREGPGVGNVQVDPHSQQPGGATTWSRACDLQSVPAATAHGNSSGSKEVSAGDLPPVVPAATECLRQDAATLELSGFDRPRAKDTDGQQAFGRQEPQWARH